MADSSTLFSKDKVFLTAELGATHTGLLSAINLVDIAINAGFDAVKFQIVESAKCPYPNELFNGVRCEDIWKQRELDKEEWKTLWEYCQGKIPAFATITDVNQVDWFPSESFKISSRSLTNLSLVSYVSKFCKTIQLDTGRATLNEIYNAFYAVEKDVDIIIHYCPSGYPAKAELRKIKEYKDKFKCKIGFSTHDNDLVTTCVAVALGADLIEIPIKEYGSVSISPENLYALDPFNATYTVNKIREMEASL